MSKIASQDKYAPLGTCFGCGPLNEKGLRIKSFWEGDDFVVHYNPEPHHQAFPGTINGGIIGTIFDCHMNWAAATKLFDKNRDKDFPSTVTSEFSVKLKRPTPYGVELLVKAWVKEISGNFVTVEAEMYANNKITSIASGIFVSVKEGHPAYHRWD